MFSHVVVGSSDLEVSRKFYDAVFAVLGAGPGSIDARGRLVYSKDGQRFLITKPINGEEPTYANGGTIGFQTRDPQMAEAWHAAGVAHGGVSIEDPPGVRDNAGNKIYLAYLRDPYGNKLCARCAL